MTPSIPCGQIKKLNKNNVIKIKKTNYKSTLLLFMAVMRNFGFSYLRNLGGRETSSRGEVVQPEV